MKFSVDYDFFVNANHPGYKILEFGKFNWGRFIEALTIYKEIHGNIVVPTDYVRSFMMNLTSMFTFYWMQVIDEEKIYSASSEDDTLKYPADLEDFKLGNFYYCVILCL